ncbi:large conductance mechanosensitive channel protein MscL [Halovulum dunhuangense]|uniref:Large-conductance mechanosensitive channel n=1 Tax=Halovulum dunhuangense TaxID=1505036 RepID=A0A849KZ03_9RHOB|nr:large conductance mechanosensitive channel protein MscL [Halovulum dunhuangense]NNU79616.1 large conductance mechanosensitive channel protein MscL [Halovulum dunhuangense]
MLNEFKAFIARGNVMDMAVGIIVGAAFTAIVSSVVADLIQPLIGLILGGIDFTNYFIALDGGDYSTLAAAQEAGAATFNYGNFITAMINFLIIAFVVFLLVKAVNRIRDAAAKPKEAAPESPKGPSQEELLAEIRDLLKAQRQG